MKYNLDVYLKNGRTIAGYRQGLSVSEAKAGVVTLWQIGLREESNPECIEYYPPWMIERVNQVKVWDFKKGEIPSPKLGDLSKKGA